MNDLFGNELKPTKVFKRDSIGRFADEKTAEYERALMEANRYKQMYLAAQSRMRGIANILRQKDELIYKLRQW